MVAGWPLEEYYERGHPLQERVELSFEDLTGGPPHATGVDGCGAPALATSLYALARAFLRLVHGDPGSVERTVADAMRAHPQLVAGPGAEDTRLMAGVPGLLSKVGAEGVIAAAMPGVGAVALKIDDGGPRPRLPVLVSALGRLGVPAPVLAELADMPVYGGGAVVGAVRSIWTP
jgi:L-asparaginase II